MSRLLSTFFCLPLIFAAVALVVLSPWLVQLDSASLALAFVVWFYLLGAYATLLIFAPLPLLVCWWRRWMNPWQIMAAVSLATITAYLTVVLQRAAFVGEGYWQWSSEAKETILLAIGIVAVGAAHGLLLWFIGVRRNTYLEQRLQNRPLA